MESFKKKIWRKGQVSGFVQKVKEIRIDDDQDSVWLSVDIGMELVVMLVIDLAFIDQYLWVKLKMKKN